MAKMTSLVSFLAANNKLSGSLPSDWLSSPLLQVFNVVTNKLSGSLPQPGSSNFFRDPSTDPDKSRCAD